MIKKYIVAFHHVFNDVHVLRRDKDQKIIKDITVPCSYVGKSKMFYLLQDTTEKRVATTLPRMSFLITNLSPDPSRKEPQINEIPFMVDGDREIFMYSPIPYNFNVQFSIWTEYTDDLMQIIEQVGTFFRPDYTFFVEEIAELEIRRNISIVLNQMNLDITNEFGPEEDRTCMADIDFTLKGYLYPPIKEASIIKMINIRFTDSVDRCLDIANINHTFDEITALERETAGAMRVTANIVTNTEN
jgi:hypothetical protein